MIQTGLLKKFLPALAGALSLTAAASAVETLPVNVFNLDFSMDPVGGTPRDPTIYVGDTIRWTWSSTAGIHSVTSIAGSSEVYSDGPIGGAGSPHTFDHTFTIPGVHQYYCSVHGADTGGSFSGMGGFITVRTAIAGWTFESQTIAITDATDAGPYTAEFGAITLGSEARGRHASSLTDWSTVAGNGSAKSFSSNNWAIGDYYQFKAATTGYEDIHIAWDQTRSSTGPATFDVQYSLDGSAFTTIVSGYTVSSAGFTSGTFAPLLRFTPAALPSSLDDQPAVYIRVRCASTPGGTAGTNRIDNVVISGDAIPSCAAPTISDDPDDLTVPYGDPASFSVTASGSGTLSYQWLKDSTPLSDGGTISGATTDTLSISAADVSDAGSYECVVTNDCGFASTDATSAAAVLTVDCTSPSITDDPDDTTTVSGGTTVLTAAASGTGTLTYQWRKDTVDLTDGGRISGATTDTLTINPTGFADEGTYDVVVSGPCGSATSAGAEVTSFCHPDCDGNHVLNINDAICLKAQWDAQTPYGDYNGDGKYNIRDFTAWHVDFNLYVSQGGCLN